MTRRSRLITAAVVMAAGIAALAAGLVRVPDGGGVLLGLAGAGVAGFAVGSLASTLRRPASLIEQDELVRRLWQAAHDLGNGQTFGDPETGCLLVVQRLRGFTTLIVTETTGDLEGLCRLYFLAFANSPRPAPLLRRTDHLDLPEPATASWRQIAADLDLGETTGAMHADTGEITDVIARVERAIPLDDRE